MAPKSVFAKTEDPRTGWILERLSNGKYYLYIGGAPVADEKSFLVALLIGREPKVKWELEELESGLIRYGIESV